MSSKRKQKAFAYLSQEKLFGGAQPKKCMTYTSFREQQNEAPENGCWNFPYKFEHPSGLLRWPTTVTAKSFYSQQNQFRHGKINFITAKSTSSQQNQFRCSKINLATAKSISPLQNQFHTICQNQFYTQQNQFCNTAKSISLTAKSFSLTAK